MLMTIIYRTSHGMCANGVWCVLRRAGYKVGERNLGPDDVIAKIPVPQTSPTSYRAFLRTDYIRVRPDWVLSIVMEADKLARTFDRKGKRIRRPPFDVKSMKFQCLQEAGVPYLWVYNAWEARLQVGQLSPLTAFSIHYKIGAIRLAPEVWVTCCILLCDGAPTCAS